jgi:hypothetical protein
MGFNWDAFAGGIAKGIQTEQDMRIRREEADWQKKQRARQETEWADEDALRAELKRGPKVGDVIGGSYVAEPSYDTADLANEALNAARTKLPATIANAPTSIAPQIDPEAMMRDLNLPALPKFDGKGNPIAAPARAAPRAPTPAAAPAAAMATPNTPAPAAAAPKVPTYGETYLSGDNDFGVDLNKAVVFYDPHIGKYRVTDESRARKADQLDVFSHAAATYAAHGQIDKALDIGVKANQLIQSNAAVARTRALSILDKAMVSPGGLNEGSINAALDAMNSDNSITLGARFQLMKTDKGYTLGAAPDGAGLPAQPLSMFGTYDNPAQVYEALRAVVGGEGFGDLQARIFNQTTTLRQLGIQERAQAETERHNKAGEAIDWAQVGVAREGNRLRATGAGGSVGGTSINRKDLTRFDQLTRTLMKDGTSMEDAQAKAFSQMPAAFQQAYAAEYGGIYDPRKDGGNPGRQGPGGNPAGAKSSDRSGGWNPLTALFGAPERKPTAPPKRASAAEIGALARTAQGNIKSYNGLDGWSTPGLTMLRRSGDTRRSINAAVDAARNSGLPEYAKKPGESEYTYGIRLRQQLGLPREW